MRKSTLVRSRTWLALFALLLRYAQCEEGPRHREIPQSAVWHEYGGLPRWRVLDVFTSRQVTISCGREFKVYPGRTRAEVQSTYNQNAAAWCSRGFTWDTLFNHATKDCSVNISPYGSTVLAVVHNDFNPLQRQTGSSCSFKESTSLSPQLITSLMAGLALFMLAPRLAKSISFRISVGGLLSVVLCSLVMLFFVWRHIRRNKFTTSLAAFGALGVSVSALFQMFFRYADIPEHLVVHLVVGYVLVSFLLGMAISYYFDTGNEKLLDILSAALRLIGVGLVFYGLCQLWELAALVITMLSLGLVMGERLLKIITGGGRVLHKAVHTVKAKTPRIKQEPVEEEPIDLTAIPEEEEEGEHAEDAGGSSRAGSSSNWLSSPLQLVRPRSAHVRDLPPLLEERPEHRTTQRDVQNIGAAMSAPAGSPADHDSPLLGIGIVQNLATGRTIKVGGRTYETLLQQGYVLDRKQGTLSPPPASPDMLSTGRAHTPRSTPPRRSSRRSATRGPGSGPGVPGGSTATSPL